MQYQDEIRLGKQTSPISRLDLFLVINFKDYVLQLLKKIKLHTKIGPETVH